MRTPIKHIIFDLYGTLADGDKSHLPVKRGQLMRFGCERWMIRDVPEREFFPEFCAKHGCNVDDLSAGFEAMEADTKFFEGIPPLLEELRLKGCKLHLISNCGRITQRFIEACRDVFHSFSSVTLSFKEGVVKPDIAAFKNVLDKIGARPEECVMIGNSECEDIQPAKELGMQAIQFRGRKDQVSELRKHLGRLHVL